ncbi:hypothetical protein SAMN05518854_109136 [Variovorax sp. YR266]|uniref:hypothetical protein n=1 Tax=Variovorax sp. YR266 TaxID=1884386 RepID=UPI0008948828|nr:hypothetical protein [Variovorax sp. YR266]SDZ64601.1 hypothetical protein SAMN05518854_109136 [Variovorax sp. YR266]
MSETSGPIGEGTSPERKKVSQGDLQKTFIAMLFAFAVSVVAQQISELLIVATSNWKFALWPGQIYTNAQAHIWALLSVATHSLLALLMLSVSWVMWSKSQAAGHLEDINEIFSLKFITFLMEVLLVTLYFSLSKSAEGDFASYAKDKTIASYLTPSSAKPEAMQLFWIFIIFAVWDYIVDVIKSPQKEKPNRWWGKIWDHVTGVLTYCSISMLCAVGALLVYCAAPIAEHPTQAFAGDIALMAMILLFNRAKAWEHYVFKIFPAEESRKNTKRMPTLRGNVLIAFLLLIYSSCILAITILIPCFQK